MIKVAQKTTNKLIFILFLFTDCEYIATCTYMYINSMLSYYANSEVPQR